jgi:hypothetical protein
MARGTAQEAVREWFSQRGLDENGSKAFKEGTVTAGQDNVRRHIRKLLDKLAQHLARKRDGSVRTAEADGKQ